MVEVTPERMQQHREVDRAAAGAARAQVDLGKDFDPGYRSDLVKKRDGAELLRTGIDLLAEYQRRLAAQDTHGVLVCLQSLDAGGKDGTIRHVMSGVNPQGVHVSSFKVPSATELDHDYLWRYARALPARGDIGIFNRSHYEEVLVVRVHPEAPGPPEAAAGGRRRERRLGPPLPGDQRLGALPGRQRVRGRQALPEPVQGGAAEPVPEADRRPGAELEVLRRRRPGTRAVGRLPAGVLADAVGDQHRAGRPGTSSRPTTSGSPASARRPCSPTR